MDLAARLARTLGRRAPAAPPAPLARARGTSLPAGAQWIAHDKANGRAAQRRIRQLAARGLRICRVCDHPRPLTDVPLAETPVCEECLAATTDWPVPEEASTDAR